MSDYVYPGFRPFVDRAAEDRKIPEANRHRVPLGPLFREIDDAVGQLPGMADRERRMLIPKGSTQALVDRIKAAREVLAAQLAAVDLAIAEVLGAVAPPRATVVKNEPKPRTAPKAKD